MEDLHKSKNKDILKILNVWENLNKINKPNPEDDTLDIIDQIASFFAAGSYYYYIFNFSTLKMDFVSESIKEVLGVDAKGYTIEKLFSLFHPDDLARMHEKENAASEFLFNILTPDEIPYYKVVYLMRFKDSNGNYKKILHQSRAINVNEEGKIQQVLGVHTDITYLNIPIDHKISFIGINRPSYYALDPCNMVLEESRNQSIFTQQELKIIQLIAEGKNTDKIADLLFVSTNTIKTHKKNILRKSGANNAVQLIANCIREGII